MKYLLALLFLLPLIGEAYAQETIIVNQTAPCFLNYTAGIDMWENCGAADDYISFSLLSFEWITGGFFTMILVSIIILAVYLKYHKAVYAFAVGVIFLPISFQFFPDVFFGFVIIVTVLGFAAALTWMIRELRG